jgi:DNA polymerase elongation subunit (family B)
MLKNPSEMLCWAARWDGTNKTFFKKWDDPRFLEDLWDLLNEADEVVTYNGNSFDLKHISREFLLAGMGPPSPYNSLDLYREVRRAFHFPSYKLDYVCRELGLGNKVIHTGIELWFDCIAEDERAWRLMEKYNKRDVLLLPKLRKAVAPWIRSGANAGLFLDSTTRPACPSCGSSSVQSRGTYRSKVGSYQRWHCTGCGTWSRSRKSTGTTSENVLVRAK